MLSQQNNWLALTIHRSFPTVHHILFRPKRPLQTSWDQQNELCLASSAHLLHRLRIGSQYGNRRRGTPELQHLMKGQTVLPCGLVCMQGLCLQEKWIFLGIPAAILMCCKPRRAAYSSSEISNFSTLETSVYWPVRDAVAGLVSLTWFRAMCIMNVRDVMAPTFRTCQSRTL
jgi:hypothetical protein